MVSNHQQNDEGIRFMFGAFDYPRNGLDRRRPSSKGLRWRVFEAPASRKDRTTGKSHPEHIHRRPSLSSSKFVLSPNLHFGKKYLSRSSSVFIYRTFPRV